MDNLDKNGLNELKKGDIKSMLINSVDEQILQMKPSTELITYYRKKVDDLKHSYLSLEVQLEVCKKVCESNHHAQEELIRRNDEVSQLTNAVSDLQVYLYQEREHVLKLSAENDKLRLCQLEYQKKFDTVLSFAGLPKDFITFLCIDPQQDFVVPRKDLSTKIVKRKALKNGNKELLNEIVNGQNDISQLKIQALLAEWEEQSELYHDELHSLLSDRDLRQKEWDAEQERLQQQISNLNGLLKSVQSNVCDDTDRLIKMEKRHRSREEAWIEEKSNLLKCLEASHEAFHSAPQNSRHLKSQLSSLKKHLIEKDSTISKYQDQIAALEQTIGRLKDEIEFNKNHNKERCLKFTNQIRFFKQKCEDEKRRRLLDAEGFRNDIKFLRNRVQTLERKIFSNTTSPE